jgi:hypothetical protein
MFNFLDVNFISKMVLPPKRHWKKILYQIHSRNISVAHFTFDTDTSLFYCLNSYDQKILIIQKTLSSH